MKGVFAKIKGARSLAAHEAEIVPDSFEGGGPRAIDESARSFFPWFLGRTALRVMRFP
jgi:hypothetical protein